MMHRCASKTRVRVKKPTQWGSGPRGVATVLILVVALLAMPILAAAGDAQDELGNWLIYNGTLTFHERWALFTEAQLRLWEPLSNPQEFFVRGIGLYKVSPRVTLGLGYTWVKTEPFQDESPGGTEDRLIEQAAIKHHWSKSGIEHRFRLEQRWLQEAAGTHYRNRLRYRLQATTPLWAERIEAGAQFLNLYNELFLNYTDADDTFDQNRLYAAYGFQLIESANLQLGLLWQKKKSADFLRLQIFYTHNFDVR